MACDCLDRHLEDRILKLDAARDALPRWAWMRRWTTTIRIATLFDLLFAVRASQLGGGPE